MNHEEYLNYYRQTSMYTYLGQYEDFAKSLPNDIEKLCILQRMQTIHPSAFYMNDITRKDKNNFYGDMTQIPEERLNCEEDIFPTAMSILAELLRRDPQYSVNREAKNKIHILCRGNALLLASILKAKGIPARVRNGFAKYHYETGLCDDQWNAEYYDREKNQWIMVDASGIGTAPNISCVMTNVPQNFFITAAEAWIGIRKNSLEKGVKILNVGGYTELQAAWYALMSDFNALMNNEIPVIYDIQYPFEKENGRWDFRGFTEKELEELDFIAELMKEPEANFERLQHIFKNKVKFKKFIGTSVWNK